jgi:ABC-type multidrug transport system fused ATPase/permease subunit
MSPKDRLIQSEHRFEGKYDRSMFETLKFSYRPYRWWLVLFFVVGLIGRGLLLANANFIGWWVDSLCEGPRCRPLPAFFTGWDSHDFITLLAAAVGVGFVMTWIFRVGFSDVSAWSISTLYDETTYRTSRFPISFFDRTPVGRVVTRFSSDYGNVFRLFGGPLAEFISIVFDLIWMVILITTASPLYLPLLVLIASLNYLAYRRNRNRLRECRRELSASRSPSIAHFSETAQGAPTIRSFIKQTSFSKRFEDLDHYFLTQKLRTTKAIVSFALQMNTLTASLLGLAGLLSIYGVQHGLLSLGSVGVAFGFITLSGNTVQMFFEWLAQFEEAMVGVERMNQYLRMDLEPGARLPRTVLFPTAHPRDDESEEKERLSNPLSTLRAAPVRFDNVSFRYSSDLPWIFQDLDFEVKAGERFGIVGRTGSGKSSLIQALFHLYPVEQGRITVGGLHPRLGSRKEGLDLLAYRRALAFIAQDPTLFRGTLRDNLDVEGRCSDEQMVGALQKVGLKEWASSSGLDEAVEEKGRNFSLGEKQLICLARCLLQNAPVVIMDEATSSIDPKSEEILVKATEEFFSGRTQLIIAHRLSTLRSCDRILWLQNGKIRMIGTPAEVLPQFEKANLSFGSDSGILSAEHGIQSPPRQRE